MKDPISLTTDFVELYQEIRTCEACFLHKTRKNAVPGEGPQDAQVMFIGEAPGLNEDREGRPFVGRSGSFLEELIVAAGLKRSEVYICNVLKCRPPDNRDPLPVEINSCSDFVGRQIQLIDPFVIVTLGRHSMRRFFPDATISRFDGQPKRVEGRLIVPMYHPAAALHRGNLKATILDDFAKLPGFIDRVRSLRQGEEVFENAKTNPVLKSRQLDLFED